MKARKEIKNIKKYVHGGFDYEELKAFNLRKDKIIDFSSNINPLGSSKKVIKLLKSFNDLSQYPDSKCLKLRKFLAKKLNLEKENIIVGNGSVEIIYLISSAYLNKKDKVIICSPTFSEYERSAKLMGIKVIYFKLKENENFKLNEEKIISLIKREKPKIVFLCNPNNPTGEYLNESKVKKIFNAHNKTLFVLDEAYVDFTETYWNSIKLLKNKTNVIIIRSLTKTYGLAGIRLGFCLANEEIIDILNKVKTPWNVNIIAQKLGIIALKDKKYLQDAKKEIKSSKEFLIKEFEKLNIKVIPSDVNFFLIKVKNAREVRAKLLKKGILVRDCTSFELPNFIRISIRKKNECKKLIESLKQL
jgi:histidinol-phosphate aminotransferase